MRGETLTQFTLRGQRKNPGATGEFTSLINDIGSACKTIAHAVRRGALSGNLGVAGSQNVQGESQKTLDVIANQLFIGALEWTGHIAAMVSEENDEVISIPAEFPRGKYLVCFDPLDGSSNVDVNLSVGTIFSILRRAPGDREPVAGDFLQNGLRQVAAGFCIYGPSTQLILSVGDGVYGFTLDQDIGEFVLTHPEMRIPEETAEFAINMSNRRYWEVPVERYIDECLRGVDGGREKNFNMRWVASMVAEVYRILTRGGIFLYPFDNKDPAKPGRLRLMYEANPMAFIVEQAGGAASTGRERILEVSPAHIHQRIPVILGSKSEVERVVAYHHQLANR